MSAFSSAAADYLATRRAMGYKLACQGRLLGRFVAYLEAVHAEHLTVTHALCWAKQRPDSSPLSWLDRLGIVRGFARYLGALDPATEVPPVGLISKPRQRFVPYIYSDEDVARLVEAAGRLADEHRADTYRTLIGLVAVTGMRSGEAIRLDREDVDVSQGLLTIRNTKYGKSRQLPLHQSTVEALVAYARRRDERQPKPNSSSFFTSMRGDRLFPSSRVCGVFHGLVCKTGLASPDLPHPPRLYDLRHTFAVRCLIGWYREGLDVERRLPLLSTYLGHIAPSSTYWYLSAVPELLELAARRLSLAKELDR